MTTTDFTGAYQQVTVSALKTMGVAGTNPTFTPDIVVPKGASSVLLQAETQNIRFTGDRQSPTPTTPTAAIGMLLIAGDAPIRLEGQGIMEGLQFFPVTGSPLLNVQFVMDSAAL